MGEFVVMPKLGLTMERGDLVAWLKEVGEAVDVGEPLCEVETDKLTVEVESPADGVLLARIEPGADVPVGEPIAMIGAPGDDVSAIKLFDPAAPLAQKTPELPAQESATKPAAPLPADFAAADSPSSPAARKRARELGIDLQAIRGSGPAGRVTLSDVEAAAEGGTSGRVGNAGPASAEFTPGRTAGMTPSRLRRATAEAMSISAGIPQFSLERDVDVTGLLEAIAAHPTPPPSLADAVILAVARALTRNPAFLRSWDDGHTRLRDRVNIGVAVAIDDGLVVPVLADADRLEITEIASARRQLQEQAARGRLASTAQAVFTVTNLGPFGVHRFTALLNPPESGILALGQARARDARREVTLTLSADHRVVDGLDGARLLADIAQTLEEGIR
jgi:pyruvate dehydrogenase E2 component (dihydrolipoamide acetyltransferase)